MKAPSQRNNQIYDAFQNKTPVSRLSQQYNLSQQRIHQIINQTGVYRLRADLRTLCQNGGTDSQALDLYHTIYSALNYRDEDILTMWTSIQKGSEKPAGTPYPDITTFFTQTLKNILSSSQFTDIKYSSRIAMVSLTNDRLAKIEFASSSDRPGIYNAIRVTVIHKTNGPIDQTDFYLNEILEPMPAVDNAGQTAKFPVIEQEITDNSMDIHWNGVNLKKAHYDRLQRAIVLYLRTFL